MQEVYRGLEPAEVWRHFGALNGIPRPSRGEAAARAYSRGVAAAAGALCAEDARGNLVVSAPASPGAESAPAVAVQAHLDMVCERRPGVSHDFAADPIRPRREGEYIYASGTTLGADNGIGAACALALLTTPGLRRGPLELLFTVEEETGLHGARELDPRLVAARLLVNLDSEDPRELTVGCAGGGGTVLQFPIHPVPAGAGRVGRELVVAGLKGGHSGVQIHERLANALRLLLRVLDAARENGIELELGGIRGGNAHNAIPRDAAAMLALTPAGAATLDSLASETAAAIRDEWGADEPGFQLASTPVPAPERVLPSAERNRLLGLLAALPHGVLAMSTAFPGKVETSSNLAQVVTREQAIEIGTSGRSFVPAELEAVQDRIARLAADFGAAVQVRDPYPGWEPDPSSRLLAVSRRAYERSFGVPPEVQVIHAGLECGVLVSRLPGMEAISFGPRIEGAHTPEERVHIPTVASTWRLLTALLADLAPSS